MPGKAISGASDPQDECNDEQHNGKKGKTKKNEGFFAGFLRFFHIVRSFQEKGLLKPSAAPPA
jgi:hypothetical protein